MLLVAATSATQQAVDQVGLDESIEQEHVDDEHDEKAERADAHPNEVNAETVEQQPARHIAQREQTKDHKGS